MTEKKSYDRRESESDAQRLGYTIYQGLGPSRTLSEAYSQYLEKAGKSRKKQGKAVSSVSLQPSGSFARWAKENDWDDRAKDWDLDEEARFREIQIKEEAGEYTKDLREFQKLQISSGRLGVQLALKIKSDLAVFCNIQKANPKTKTIESLPDAERYARILTSIEAKSSEQWSKGLLIEELMKALEANEAV